MYIVIKIDADEQFHLKFVIVRKMYCLFLSTKSDSMLVSLLLVLFVNVPALNISLRK